MEPGRLTTIRDTLRADPATLENADGTDSSEQGGGCLPGLLIALVLTLAAGILTVVLNYRAGLYTRLVDQHLAGQIERVEIQPYPGAAQVDLTDPADIGVVSSFVRNAEPSPERRLLVKPPACDVVLHFADGRAEWFKIGEARPTSYVQGQKLAPGTSLAISWRGYLRYRDAGAISDLYARLRDAGKITFPEDPEVVKTPAADHRVTADDRRAENVKHVHHLVGEATAAATHQDLTGAHLDLREALGASPEDAEVKAALERWKPEFDGRRADLLAMLAKLLDSSKPGALDGPAYLEAKGWLREAEALGGQAEASLRERLAARRPAPDFSRFTELVRFRGEAAHRHEIRAFAFHPDGRRVVAACADEYLRVWDAATGLLERRVLAHPAFDLSFRPDGKSFVTFGPPSYNTISPEGHSRVVHGVVPSRNGILGLLLSWDAATFAQLGEFPVDKDREVFCARFRPDGRQLLVGGSDRTASLWDADTRTKIRELAHFPGYVHAAAFLPDGRHVLLGTDERSWTPWHAELRLSIHDLADGRTVAEQPPGVSRFAVPSPDGRRLLVTSGNIGEQVHVLGLPGLQPDGVTLVGHADRVTAASWSPDGRTIATVSWDRTARLWDAATGRELALLSGHAAAPTHALFSPDGDRVLTHARDDSIVVWGEPDTSPLTQVVRLRGRESAFDRLTLLRPLESAVVSPDGRWLAAAEDKGLRVLDLATGKELRNWPRPPDVLELRPLVISPSGRDIAVDVVIKGAKGPDGPGSPVFAVQVFDAMAGRVRYTLDKNPYAGHVAAFSHSGVWLSTAAEGGETKCWDLFHSGSRRVIASQEGSAPSRVERIAFSPDDRSLLVTDAGEGGSVSLYGLTDATALLRKKVRHHSPFSPDGRFLALCPSGETYVSIIDLATINELRRLDFPDKPDRVEALAFSPDGKRLAMAMFDRSVLIVDTQEFRKLIRFPIHSLAEFNAGLGKGPDALLFAPDGRHLLVAVDDGSYRLCDTTTGREVRRLIVFKTVLGNDATIRPQPLGPARFLPDGRSFVTGAWLWGVASSGKTDGR